MLTSYCQRSVALFSLLSVGGVHTTPARSTLNQCLGSDRTVLWGLFTELDSGSVP